MNRDDLVAHLAHAEVDRLSILAQLIAENVAELLGGPQDRLLTVDEAATMLAVTNDWLYRHAEEFSFTVRPGPGQVRFSNLGIQDYLRKQRR
jgi:predicted DNA-binding transcriptional regulator AlpA